METLEGLLQRIRSCDVCKADLPLGPRPIVRASSSAKLLIIGQAPGTKVHQSGVPWVDPSGDRLRDWLNLDAETFYDDARVAIVPTGFCYPGRDPKGGVITHLGQNVPRFGTKHFKLILRTFD